jgi:hypothetical protein
MAFFKQHKFSAAKNKTIRHGSWRWCGFASFVKVVLFTKKKNLDDSIKWIRNKNPEPEDRDEPTTRAIADLVGTSAQLLYHLRQSGQSLKWNLINWL